jgi:hypothetical protein
MARLTLLALLSALALRCGGDDRDALLRSTFARADDALARSRPALLAGRYALMASSPVSFYRGALALYLRDWRDGAMELSRSRFAVDDPMPLGVGDPHVENFGTLQGPDGRLTLEPNDLDGADRVPYLWDLRRLTVGLCVAARASNPDSASANAVTAAAARDIARDAARAYADALAAPLPAEASVTAGDGVPMLADLFRRAQRDADRRTELSDLSAMTGTTRALRRGVIDPEEPTATLADLPPWAVASLPALFERYRATLREPPEAAYFTVLDAARQFGSGVASLPRIRLLVLVRGPTDAPDDDVIVEVKEQTDSITPGGVPPGVYFDGISSRVLAARDALWSRPDADPRWGAALWFGLPVQLRTETEAAKSLRVARMTGALGTPDALRALARLLGAQLARIHRRTLPSPAPHAAVIARAPDAFADEQADLSVRYAAQVFDDHARFQRLIAALGPTLGALPSPDDVASSPVRALFGTPP